MTNFNAVDDLKITEEALRDSKQFIKTIITSAQEGIIVYDRFLCYRVWNAFMERITGMSERSVLGKYALDVFPHLGEQGADIFLKRALSGETVQTPDMAYMIPSTGKSGWVASTYAPHRLSDGEIIGVVGIVKDITERKQAEEALAAEREHLAVTLRSIGDGVLSTDREGRIVLMNKVAESLTGWSLEEAHGRPLAEVFHIIRESDRLPGENPVEKVLKTSAIVSLANHTVLVSRDGREMIIADSGAPIRDKEGKTIGVVLVFRDNTDKQRSYDNLIKADKIESIGVLAGGIAHDFNNLLGGIFGYIELARGYAGPNEKVVTTLDKALKVFNRARDLTRQLLTFSKGGSPDKKAASIGQLLEETAHFALSGSNVRCRLTVPKNLWVCEIDAGQIAQAIDNILINAQHAMPQGGEISIGAENIIVESGFPAPLTPGRYVKISIKDRGTGIAREHLQKIFDPFFTTKQKGSGLGLATSYSILQKHGGFIDVESVLGAGSTFILYLPASRELPQSRVEPPKLPAKAHRGQGYILVMDDEEFIRDVACIMLTNLGYTVDCAASGEQTIAFVKDLAERNLTYGAVILDLTVPGGMGGKETLKKLTALYPGIKAIASSGYSDDPVMADPKKYGFVDRITKPYLKEEMSTVLARVTASVNR
jgi:PAS domain S-box-containing protein